MTANKLKLNDEKTEALLTGPISRTKLTQLDNITAGSSSIPLASSAKNLGVTFDAQLNMETHVSNISRTCFYIIRNISCIRRHLTTSATKTLVISLIISRLDYCNSLLIMLQNH